MDGKIPALSVAQPANEAATSVLWRGQIGRPDQASAEFERVRGAKLLALETSTRSALGSLSRGIKKSALFLKWD
jgi:hypothetical protein